MRSLLGTLLVFIFAAAAPSAVTAQSISVDQGCYTMDSQGSVTIVVTFTNDANAAASDWIGIVPADQASNALTNVDAWVFTCGDTSCTSVASQGVAPLQATLAQVDWKAVLSRSANSPYMAYAVSTSFSIGSVCGTGSGGLLPNASASLSQPAIQVSSGTFLVGETITVSYQLQGSSSGVDDFIGIFPSSINSNQLLNEGLLWKLLCNRQGQNCPTSAIPTVGTVKFSGSSASWHQASDWPLQVGTYRAYLLQNNVALSFWPVMAQSDTFTITTNTINDNERALLHITDARSAIESLIRSDDTLAPKFLRMGFHDCIGGCDGTSAQDHRTLARFAKFFFGFVNILSSC